MNSLKRVAASLAAGAAVAAGFTIPAEAATTKWCNSFHSYHRFTVLHSNGKIVRIYPGNCYYRVTSGDRIQIWEDGYRTGRDYGPWSRCKGGNVTIDPPNTGVYYVKVYRWGDCTN